jgi:hypothetical protein
MGRLLRIPAGCKDRSGGHRQHFLVVAVSMPPNLRARLTALIWPILIDNGLRQEDTPIEQRQSALRPSTGPAESLAPQWYHNSSFFLPQEHAEQDCLKALMTASKLRECAE